MSHQTVKGGYGYIYGETERETNTRVHRHSIRLHSFPSVKTKVHVFIDISNGSITVLKLMHGFQIGSFELEIVCLCLTLSVSSSLYISLSMCVHVRTNV